MASCRRNNDLYIYNLPYTQVKELCRILDRDNKWEELAGMHMRFDMTTIEELRRCERRDASPTERLLSLWGHQNHTVTKLFILLSKMHHYRAMLVLKPLVDSQFHPLLFEGEEIQICQKQDEDGSGAEGSQSQNGSSSSRPPLHDKDMNIGSANLNVSKNEYTTNISKKLVFPLEQPVERKVVNVAENVVSNECNSTITSNAGAACPLVREDVVARQAESKENNYPAPNPQRKMSNSSDASSKAGLCLNIPEIPYNELKQATNNWSKTSIIGKGGFGTVFKGNWKNTLVAIKRIEQRGAESAESYQTQIQQSLHELRILNACRHDNVLPVYGISVEGAEPCLVYQFMPNGSLEDRLLCRHGTIPLTWSQRHNIAVGTARGLQFLHTNGKPFIHGDIKSANILLNNNFEARIGDFGLAREGPENQYTHMQVSRVHGTLPYLPDEFLRSRLLSTKVDTFSFGIVLFELGTGLRAYDENRPKKLLKDRVESCQEEHIETLRDTKAGTCEIDIFMHLMTLGKWCVSQRARDRPEMEEVLKRLENTSSFQRLLQYPPQMGSVSPSNPYPAVSPLPFMVPGNVSPEPMSFANMIPLAANVRYVTPYQFHQQAQVSPTLHPALQHNIPFLGQRMRISQEESGNSSIPTPPGNPLQQNLVLNVNNAQPHDTKFCRVSPNSYVPHHQQLSSQERPNLQLIIPTADMNGIPHNIAAAGVDKTHFPRPVIAVSPPSDNQFSNGSSNLSNPTSAKTGITYTNGSLVQSKNAEEDTDNPSPPGSDIIPWFSVLIVEDSPSRSDSNQKITARDSPAHSDSNHKITARDSPAHSDNGDIITAKDKQLPI